jgi:uncharacterized membrane protein YfcA
MLLTAQRPSSGAQDPPERPAIPVRSACWGRKATELSPNCPQNRIITLYFPNAATTTSFLSDLLYAGVTKAVGTAVHGHNGAVSWRIVGLLAGGSVPASAATLLVLNALGPRTHATSALISFVLGFAFVATAASILLRGRLIALTQNADALPPARQAVLTVVTGAAIGVLVSISSIGAGAIGVTALYFLYPKLPAKTIVGSDIAHAVPLTLIAGSGYWCSVQWTAQC